jgi:hypoxanthine phosphoribosyltransferase
MKTVTLDNDLFKNSVLELWSQIITEYIPDKVIVVESGGGHLVDVLIENGKVIQKDIIRIKATRKLTGLKKSRGATLIKLLPDTFSILLRNIESYIKEFIFTVFKQENERVINFVSGNISEISGKKVLILDDAVDSGVTLRSIVEFVQMNASEKIEIKTASLTVTFKKPLVFPNYFLYKRTLIRFPWSIDVAK